MPTVAKSKDRKKYWIGRVLEGLGWLVLFIFVILLIQLNVSILLVVIYLGLKILGIPIAMIAIGVALIIIGRRLAAPERKAIAVRRAIENLYADISESYRQWPDKEYHLHIAMSDKKAKEYGWPDASSMQNGVQEVLRSLPPEIAQHCIIKQPED